MGPLASARKSQSIEATEQPTEFLSDYRFDRFGQPFVFPRGVELFRQGSKPSCVYYVEAGLVKHVFCNDDGREVIINLAKPKMLLGAYAVILREAHWATAVTLQRCQLRCVSAAEFLESLETSHHFSLVVNGALSREALDQVIRAGELGVVDARSRLEQLLRGWCATLGNSTKNGSLMLQLPITHSEVAQLLAVTPQYLSRLLKQMEQEGVLRRAKRGLFIRDPTFSQRSS